MKQTETASFLAVIKTAYPFFEITVPVTRLWHQMLEGMNYEVAKERLGHHIRTSRFAPTIADITGDDQHRPSFYQLQRVEEEAYTLELEEYNETAIPMPEHLIERFERSARERKVNTNEH
ncbi:replicative helicase loader/inhibitor [Paenibacillus sp. FSL W8-0426]|uniref:replicative helicase loader/inhibitor n=1 Tax=Paenibacillus sp. FSL W8-0426 TaxID=2921714 RepID=UPI0030D9E6A0